MRQKIGTRALCLLCGLALIASLAACGGPGAGQTQGTLPQESQQMAETQSLEATVNRIESEMGYLVLVTEDNYYRLDLGGVDVSGLEPGDSVTASYTGTLRTEDEGEALSAKLVAIEKN